MHRNTTAANNTCKHEVSASTDEPKGATASHCCLHSCLRIAWCPRTRSHKGARATGTLAPTAAAARAASPVLEDRTSTACHRGAASTAFHHPHRISGRAGVVDAVAQRPSGGAPPLLVLLLSDSYSKITNQKSDFLIRKRETDKQTPFISSRDRICLDCSYTKVWMIKKNHCTKPVLKDLFRE